MLSFYHILTILKLNHEKRKFALSTFTY